ncbi:MAG: XTP/dITP diphosphatase [Methanophagales archaeon ANME-1-THS]|nr:MAG: XTP/dITP diphosphatase [Methanophagales archaeon ANME-1-THS]
MGSKRELLFITTNQHKVKEIQELAESESRNLTIVHRNYEYPELQLDELEEVARASAKYLQKKGVIQRPFLIEDSGLFIHALHGFPGPFSAYVFKRIGNEGILKLMAGKQADERRALFKTAVAFCEPDRAEPVIFVGTVEGSIADEARGSGGFGFDPIFEFGGKTFAELSTEEKNKVSHRSRAFRKLLAFLS